MQARHTSVIMWCSERENRAYEVEIAYSRTSATIERVIALPYGYELLLDRMRRGDDEAIDIPVEVFRDLSPECPYCSQTSFFTCNCGARSCWPGRGKKVFCCPCCGYVCKDFGTITHVTGTRTGQPRSGSGSWWRGLWQEGRGRRRPEPERLVIRSPEEINAWMREDKKKRRALPPPERQRKGRRQTLLEWRKED